MQIVESEIARWCEEELCGSVKPTAIDEYIIVGREEEKRSIEIQSRINCPSENRVEKRAKIKKERKKEKEVLGRARLSNGIHRQNAIKVGLIGSAIHERK